MPDQQSVVNESPAVTGEATESGIPVASLYGGDDGKDSLSLPGEPPYTRGIHATMYSGREWSVRQLAGFGTPEDTNRRLRQLLSHGATAINTVFDYPTNRGYNSDDPFAYGDVGQGGVAVDSVDDMMALYAGVPLDQVSVSLVLSHPVAAGVVLALYLAMAERRGYDISQLRGTVQNDFMMETVVLTAPRILTPAFSFRLAVDVVEFCSREMPRWNPVSFTGYNYREAGADAVTELALVVAHAVAVLQEMEARGHSPDSCAPRLSSFFSASNDFFEEVAKFRAARRLYHRTLSSRFELDDPRSSKLRFHVQTAGSALTAQQPVNNVARAALHAFAAVLGGAQSLHVSAYDEALSIPSEAAALTALRTQQIISHETGITRTTDPLGGSYYVEHLTDEIERRAELLLEEIDKLGGLVAAVESGWVHRRLIDTSFQTICDVETGERKVVGVNCFTEDTPVKVEPFQVPDARHSQRKKLGELRLRRDSRQVDHLLGKVVKAVEAGENVMPAVLAAVREGATLGECCQIFRAKHGGWHQPLR